MVMTGRSLLVSLIPLVLAGSPAHAQEALVLSGGGSRGLSHVGALQAVEELGHDPDIVIGTSMGAVVGALYAAGYTPEEIRARVLEIDWSRVFNATAQVIGPDRSPRYSMIAFDLATDELRFSRGLVAQWRINRALAKLLFGANARARGDFDRLPRTYRAVAADLRTGEVVVISEGDLARAARASMAVPGLFAPVSWDGRVLVDGGIVNNVPTDVARSLGAARVIAVDAGKPADEIVDLSPFGVFQRAIDLMQENTQRGPPPDEMVIPDLDPASSGTAFPEDPRELFEAGLTATRRDLRPAAGEGRPVPRSLPAAPARFTRLVVEAPDSSTAALARHMFAGVAPGPYDPDAVLRSVDMLFTTGLFEAVWPTVVEDPDAGGVELHVRLEAPPAVSASAAAAYENDRGGRAWAAVTRSTSMFRRPALLTAAAASEGLDRWASASLRVYPRNRPAFTWSVATHVRERDIRVFMEETDAITDRDALRMGGSLSLGLPYILRERTATLAAVGEHVRIEDGPEGGSFGPVFRFTGLNPDVLIVGEPFLVEAEHRWGDISYSRVALSGSRRVEVGKVRLAATGDFRWSSEGTPDDLVPALGDRHSVPGLRWGELRGLTRMTGGIDAAYPIGGAFARLRARSGAVAEDPDALRQVRWVTGADAALLWRVPFGIAEVRFGVNSRGDRRTDVMVGRNF